jgi:hypothetical protein
MQKRILGLAGRASRPEARAGGHEATIVVGSTERKGYWVEGIGMTSSSPPSLPRPTAVLLSIDSAGVWLEPVSAPARAAQPSAAAPVG